MEMGTMSVDGFKLLLGGIDAKAEIYGASFRQVDGLSIAMARSGNGQFLALSGDGMSIASSGLSGRDVEGGGGRMRICPLNEANAVALRRLFPWTAPSKLSGHAVSLGCGDRLGLASAGQLDAVRQYEAFPVLAQQSTRELKLTGRTFRGVIDDACFLVFQSGYEYGYAADGDHLKSKEEVSAAVADGATMITLDLSADLVPAAAGWSDAEVEAAFDRLPEDVKLRTLAGYAGKVFQAGALTLTVSKAEAMRCAAIYSKAIDFAVEAASLVGLAADLEISVDETVFPTTPVQHLYVSTELRSRGVRFMSLAPRFVGEFQKGIDYIGDPAAFERDIEAHVAIANSMGGYKISVHSGSDKFKIFPAVGRTTSGHFHLKTAGTSWLEALRVIARHEPALFRKIVAKAESGLNDALKLYHVSSDFSKIPPPASLSDVELPSLLDMDESRQFLHITYGAIFADAALKAMLYQALHKHERRYAERLAEHFERHLSTLGVRRRIQ